MISRCSHLLILAIAFILILHAQSYDEAESAGYEFPIRKRFRAEPVRFGKRAPREPVRFGKRSTGQLFYPFELFNHPNANY